MIGYLKQLCDRFVSKLAFSPQAIQMESDFSPREVDAFQSGEQKKPLSQVSKKQDIAAETPPVLESDPLRPWKTYIQYLQRLRKIDAEEYRKVPPVVKVFAPCAIANLSDRDVEALQAMGALPDGALPDVTLTDMEVAKAYIRDLRRLRSDRREYAKVPAILRGYSDEEIEALDVPSVQALKLMSVLPNFEGEATGFERLDKALEDFCKSDPELASQLGNPKNLEKLAQNPKVLAYIYSRPDLQQLLNEEIERQRNAFLGALNLPSFWFPPLNQASSPRWYSGVAYGARQKVNLP